MYYNIGNTKPIDIEWREHIGSYNEEEQETLNITKSKLKELDFTSVRAGNDYTVVEKIEGNVIRTSRYVDTAFIYYRGGSQKLFLH